MDSVSSSVSNDYIKNIFTRLGNKFKFLQITDLLKRNVHEVF